MAIKALIIDDEPLARDIIKKYAEELKSIQIEGSCNDALEAVEILNTKKVDLLFLDINMPKLSGIEFIKTLKNPPLVILTTAHAEYALEGYELDVVDYLLKPFSFPRFVKAIQKCTEHYENKKGSSEPINESIFIKSNKKTFQVRYEEINYIEGLGDYINVYTSKTHLVTNISMKRMEEELPSDKFIRIHKSFIVNLSKINSIEGNLVEIGNKRLSIGNNYRSVFFTKIEKRQL